MFGPIILFFALQAGQSRAALHMQAGIEAHRRGQFQEAIREFTLASQLNPDFPEAFLNLGEEYVQTHDYGAAIGPLKRALELRPDLEQGHLDLGYALLSQGFPAEAIPHLERAHAVEALGVAETEAGRYQEAIENLSAALAKRPNDPDLLYYLGRAAGLLSKRSIDTLTEAYPDAARSHQAMAENYFVLRQMPQAEGEFRAALQQRPDIPGLHMELGLVYAGAAEWPKAEEEFRAETKLQPGNAEAAYRLGSALLQQGKIHEARNELTQADKLKPEMPEILYSLGKAASLEGDTAAAEKDWVHLLQVEKNTSLAAQAHFGLATIYRKQGNAAKAQSEMEEFRKLQKAVPPADVTPK